MISSLFFLFLAFLGAKSQTTPNRCGYDRTTLITKSATYDACANITLWRNCVLSTLFDSSQIVGGSGIKCLWNGNTQVCYADPTTSASGCYPSCFSNGRVFSPVTSCSSLSLATCNKYYIIANGFYSLCAVSSSSCIQRDCDVSCTGLYQPSATGAGKDQYTCPDNYFDNGTSYNFKWSGSACVIGEKCFHGCSATNYTASCSTYNGNSFGCLSHYLNTGSYGYDRANCQYNPTTGACTQAPELCSLAVAQKCTGINWGNETCSFFKTNSACSNAYVFDSVWMQCHYNLGSGICNKGDPCIP